MRHAVGFCVCVSACAAAGVPASESVSSRRAELPPPRIVAGTGPTNAPSNQSSPAAEEPFPAQGMLPPNTFNDPNHPTALRDARAERLRPSHPPQRGEPCSEAHNPQGTPSLNCGGTNLAWQYIPSMNFTLQSVEMYTNSSEFALLDNAGGRPGQPLARARFMSGNEAGWVVAVLDPPVQLEAGRTYWLWRSQGTCSIVERGAQPVYYGNFQGMTGEWTGPWRSHAFTARMHGQAR